MLDYEKEAACYDASRGGEPRAEAAASALLGLLPPGARDLLDVACGTGLVAHRAALARPGLRVRGVDVTPAMARRAAVRLPGAVVLGDARRLPFADGRFDAVATVWLLHLADRADDVRRTVAECARVLRPGGVYVTTVDKTAAHDVGSDIDAVLSAVPPAGAGDAAALVGAYAAEHGLLPAGRARFRGHGQGSSPRGVLDDLRRGRLVALPPGHPLAGACAARLAALPDQDRPRPDPVFTLRAFVRAPGPRPV